MDDEEEPPAVNPLARASSMKLKQIRAQLNELGGDPDAHERGAATVTIQTAFRGLHGRLGVATKRRFSLVGDALKAGLKVERVGGIRRSNSRVEGTSRTRRCWKVVRDASLAALSLEDEELQRIKAKAKDAMRSADHTGARTQGDLDLYHSAQLRQRKAIRNSPLVHEVVRMYWALPDLNVGGGPPPVLRERGYCKLNERLHHCLSEAFQSEDEVKASAHADWLHDLDHVPLETDLEPETLDFDSFLRSLWEVADVWTDEIDEEMYAAILWKLLDEVIVGKVREVDRVYKWHGDKNCAAKIKCIANVDPNSILMEVRARARARAPRARHPFHIALAELNARSPLCSVSRLGAALLSRERRAARARARARTRALRSVQARGARGGRRVGFAAQAAAELRCDHLGEASLKAGLAQAAARRAVRGRRRAACEGRCRPPRLGDRAQPEPQPRSPGDLRQLDRAVRPVHRPSRVRDDRAGGARERRARARALTHIASRARRADTSKASAASPQSTRA